MLTPQQWFSVLLLIIGDGRMQAIVDLLIDRYERIRREEQSATNAYGSISHQFGPDVISQADMSMYPSHSQRSEHLLDDKMQLNKPHEGKFKS